MSKIRLDDYDTVSPCQKASPSPAGPSLLPETAFSFSDESIAVYSPISGKWRADFGIAAGFVEFWSARLRDALAPMAAEITATLDAPTLIDPTINCRNLVAAMRRLDNIIRRLTDG